MNEEEILETHPFTELNKLGGRIFKIEKQNQQMIRGELHFRVDYMGEIIEDQFRIEITLTKEFPERPPSIKEIGGRIPKTFHTNPDGSLCLGSQFAIIMKLAKSNSLISYIYELVIPFLFSFCYYELYGLLPYGDLSHGRKGKIEYYKELFNVNSTEKVISILKALVENNYRGHLLCPCGSNKKLRNCHGLIFREIMNKQHQTIFFNDLSQCMEEHTNAGNELPIDFFSERLKKVIQKYRSA